MELCNFSIDESLLFNWELFSKLKCLTDHMSFYQVKSEMSANESHEEMYSVLDAVLFCEYLSSEPERILKSFVFQPNTDLRLIFSEFSTWCSFLN